MVSDDVVIQEPCWRRWPFFLPWGSGPAVDRHVCRGIREVSRFTRLCGSLRVSPDREEQLHPWRIWYDAPNRYFLIDLKGTLYHYCRFPRGVWEEFKRAVSYGQYYNAQIKGSYDCRLGGIPSYVN